MDKFETKEKGNKIKRLERKTCPCMKEEEHVLRRDESEDR